MAYRLKCSWYHKNNQLFCPCYLDLRDSVPSLFQFNLCVLYIKNLTLRSYLYRVHSNHCIISANTNSIKSYTVLVLDIF